MPHVATELMENLVFLPFSAEKLSYLLALNQTCQNAETCWPFLPSTLCCIEFLFCYPKDSTQISFN